MYPLFLFVQKRREHYTEGTFMPIYIDPIAIIFFPLCFIVLLVSFLGGDSEYKSKREQEKLNKKKKP
jgi:hypothetical protein